MSGVRLPLPGRPVRVRQSLRECAGRGKHQREMTPAAPLDVAEGWRVQAEVVAQLPAPAIPVGAESPVEGGGPFPGRGALTVMGVIIRSLAKIQISDFECTNVAARQKLMEVVELAALKTLGEAGQLRRVDLVQRVAFEASTIRLVRPPYLGRSESASPPAWSQRCRASGCGGVTRAARRTPPTRCPPRPRRPQESVAPTAPDTRRSPTQRW